MMNFRRTVTALLVVGSFALLPGCSSGDTDSAATDPSGPTDLTPFLSQEVTWRDCPDKDDFLEAIPAGAECTTVEVPVDYFDGDSGRGTMEIALIRLQPEGPSQGNLLLNPGGPGASGFDLVAASGESLQKNLPGYTIVGFDPRGVARSAGYDCKQGTSTRLDSIEADITPEDAAEFEAVYGAMEAYDEACRDAYPDWGFLGTPSVARDVHVISRALGDAGINFYGISYGSEIGYELLRTFPDDIDRMILESVVDPAVEETFADQLAAFNTQLEELVALCATPRYESCGQGRTAQEVRTAFIEAAQNIEDPAVTTLTSNGQPSESLLFWGLALPLYIERDQELTDLYVDAIGSLINNQDARQFEFWGYLYNDYDYNTSKFTAKDDIQGLVACLDESKTLADTDIAEERAKDAAEIAAIQQRAPLFAAVGFTDVYTDDDRSYQPCSYSQLAYQDDAIPDPLPVAGEVANPGAVPVLVLGVSGDTATPYAWAQTIAGKLGVPLVTQDTTGHGVYSDTDNQCTIDVVTGYLQSGALPAGPVTC